MLSEEKTEPVQQVKALSNTLCYEILEKCLSFLEEHCAISCSLVCKRWLIVARQLTALNIRIAGISEARNFLFALESNRTYASKLQNQGWPLIQSTHEFNISAEIGDLMFDIVGYFENITSVTFTGHQPTMAELSHLCTPSLKKLHCYSGLHINELSLSDNNDHTQLSLSNLVDLRLESEEDFDFILLVRALASSIPPPTRNEGHLKLKNLSFEHSNCTIGPGTGFQQDLSRVFEASVGLVEATINFHSYYRSRSYNFDGILEGIQSCVELQQMNLSWSDMNFDKVVKALEAIGTTITDMYLDMIGLQSMGDKEILCLSNLCPNLCLFTYSTYGGSYDITVDAAVEWKRKCKNLKYVGAYRMNGDVKRALQRLGVETK